MSMIYQDEMDWDGGMSMEGYPDGGEPMGGINLGGRRRAGRPRKHPMAGGAITAKTEKGLADYRNIVKKLEKIAPGRARSLYNVLKQETGMTATQMKGLSEAKIKAILNKKRARVAKQGVQGKPVQREALRLRQRMFGPPVQLSHEEQLQLSKWLKARGHGEGPCPVCEGSGFWSDFADGFKKGFTGTLDVASHILPFL